MYDITIQYKQSNQGTFNNYGFTTEQINDKTRFSYKFIDDRLFVLGKSHQNLTYKDYYEDNLHLVLINGIILARNKTGKLHFNAADIIDLLNTHTFDYDQCKGNFTLFVYNKESQVLEIYTDHFALRPMYFGVKDSSVFISNNLNILKSVDNTIDETTIFEKILFTYPITNQTYLKRFKLLEPGKHYHLVNSSIKEACLFNLQELIFNNTTQNFKYSKFNEIFNFNVRQRAKLDKKPLVTLTGGFDGRTVVASMKEQNIDFHSFSFGRKGGENTEIPLKFCASLNISYEPVYLNEDYERNYSRYAHMAIEQSDGLSPFERANYSYAYTRLRDSSPILLSGLIGGEILGILYLKTDYFNKTYYDWIYDNKQINFIKTLEQKNIKQFVADNVIDKIENELIERIQKRKDLIKNIKKQKDGYLFYLYDLISLGFRRFYGGQMHQERSNYENLLPFFDLDILEYLFSTNFIKRYKHSFSNNKIYKFLSRKPQSKLIQYNYPLLAQKKVDRGFPPKYLLNPLFYPLAYYLFKQRQKNLKGEEFISNQWSEIFYKTLLNEKNNFIDLFKEKEIVSFMKNYKPENYNQEFNKLLSVAIWSDKK